jgi:hypothetical protein
MPTKILVLDPLTLAGKELLGYDQRLAGIGGELDFRHTALDDEHQIAEIGGAGPALVPPLDSPEDFMDVDVIVVVSDGESSRHEHLLAFLDDNPDQAIVDITRVGFLDSRTQPSIGAELSESRQLRVGHPAIVATAVVVEALAHLGKCHGSLAAVDPASSFGLEGVGLLVSQAEQRMQGASVDDRIDGHILAFNLVAVDGDLLQNEAAFLLPDTPLAVTRSLLGSFHGHLAFLGLSFDNTVQPQDVHGALNLAEGIEVADFPLGLDSVPESDHIVVMPPAMSPDHTQLALTLMINGLRIGGALTALDILETLV